MEKSRIRDGKKSEPGSGMEKSSRNRDRGWKKVGTGIWDGKKSDPGWQKIGSGMENSRIRDGKKSDPGWKQVGSEIKTGSKTDAPDGRPGEEDAGAPGPGHGHAAGSAREVELLARHEHLLHLLSCSRCLANYKENVNQSLRIRIAGRISIILLPDPDWSRACGSDADEKDKNNVDWHCYEYDCK
jgi:hypothetical protein